MLFKHSPSFFGSWYICRYEGGNAVLEMNASVAGVFRPHFAAVCTFIGPTMVYSPPTHTLCSRAFNWACVTLTEGEHYNPAAQGSGVFGVGSTGSYVNR